MIVACGQSNRLLNTKSLKHPHPKVPLSIHAYWTTILNTYLVGDNPAALKPLKLFVNAGNSAVGHVIDNIEARFSSQGVPVVHDPCLTWHTIDIVEKAGGIPVKSKIGHTLLKRRILKVDVIYGGEMSAHHYFCNLAYCDSGVIPWLLVAELVSVIGCSLPQLVRQRMAVYPYSGEINCRVQDVQSSIDSVRKHFQSNVPFDHIDTTNGLSMEFPNWRLNLRGSNTEPLLHLNVETRGDRKTLHQQMSVIRSLIQGHA